MSTSATPSTSDTLTTTFFLPGLLLATAVLFTALLTFLPPSRFLRWLQLKRYQYEVTFSLYMMTPTEKFIFNSILFLLISWFLIAASLYLPEHVSLMAKRVTYYYSGSEGPVAGAKTATAVHGATGA